MTDAASYNRRPEGRWSGDIGDAGILLTDTPTIFRSRSPETDAAMIRQSDPLPFALRRGRDVGAVREPPARRGCPTHKT